MFPISDVCCTDIDLCAIVNVGSLNKVLILGLPQKQKVMKSLKQKSRVITTGTIPSAKSGLGI